MNIWKTLGENKRWVVKTSEKIFSNLKKKNQNNKLTYEQKLLFNTYKLCFMIYESKFYYVVDYSNDYG